MNVYMKKILIMTFLIVSFVTPTVNADSKPLVSVLISAKDRSHVADILSEVKKLSKNVPVVNVAIAIPGDEILDLSALENSKANSSSTNNLDKLNSIIDLKSLDGLGLTRTKIKYDESLIKRLRLSYSPTWIVKYRGEDYIFEGYRSISNHFTRTGNFEY